MGLGYKECVDDIFQKYGVSPGILIVEKLMKHLENVHNNMNVIHVAGTNGKGSVSSNIARNLLIVHEKCFCKHVNIGTFTSPHILSVRERLSINNEMISRDDFVQLYRQLVNKSQENDEFAQVFALASFFDILTVMAFLYFYYGPSNKQITHYPYCSVIVLEVGIGGRLDATNVISTVLCSIITCIGIDHTNLLGKTLEHIAAEKAGIFKPYCPVVLGIQAQTFHAIEKATVRCHSSPIVRLARCETEPESFYQENQRLVIEAIKVVIPALFPTKSFTLAALVQLTRSLHHVPPLYRYWVVPSSMVQKALRLCFFKIQELFYMNVLKGHNESAINRVAQQFKIDGLQKNIRVACCLSKTRNLNIFQPILSHFPHAFCESKGVTKIHESHLNGIHYLNIEHPRTLTFKEISTKLNENYWNADNFESSKCVYESIKISQRQFEDRLKKQFLWKRKQNIALTFEETVAFLFFECFIERSNLLFIGSSFLMKPILQFLQWI
ncbi:dihydrofolate synthase/folylpolyglutamate synthase-like isoform X2 [Hylaeus volcanicus]|uniref:dihydrofolate synthase/folylpolyglutamate synthase-like isoform X2 n=1 Tax=Hylaeus volcanicus TaxID=313075 RepID=UPI0023B84915|nr:dihydrofolate synthase/folylpolyglutamate synthase-like isoform X2 [Hylaeus volcanicus]